jgi:hypothetical protein
MPVGNVATVTLESDSQLMHLMPVTIKSSEPAKQASGHRTWAELMSLTIHAAIPSDNATYALDEHHVSKLRKPRRHARDASIRTVKTLLGGEVIRVAFRSKAVNLFD